MKNRARKDYVKNKSYNCLIAYALSNIFIQVDKLFIIPTIY
jgi:hypothetical protein